MQFSRVLVLSLMLTLATFALGGCGTSDAPPSSEGTGGAEPAESHDASAGDEHEGSGTR